MLSCNFRRSMILTCIAFVTVSAGAGLCATVEPSDHGEQLDFADSLYVRQMYDMAAREYETYLDNSGDVPESEVAYFRLGEAYYHQKEYSKTVRALTTLLEKFPSSGHSLRATLRLGEVQFRLANHEQAIGLLDKVVAAEQNGDLETAALYYLGQAHLAAGNTDKCAAALNRLITDYPKHGLVPYARFTLATAYFETKGFTNAAKQFSAMAEANALPSSLRAEATFKAGLAYAENKDFDKGIALLDRTIKEHPKSEFVERAAYERAWTTYHADKTETALELAGEFIDRYPASELVAGAMYLKGKSLQSLGQYADAETVYAGLLKDHPSDPFVPRARCQMCWTAYWRKRYDTAAERAGALYESLDGDLRGETLFIYGRALTETKKFDKALSAFGELLDKHPNTKFAADAEFQRARALASLGKHEQAATEFTGFSEKRPDHPLATAARINVAQQEFMTGSFTDAAAHYAKLADKTDDDSTRQTALFMLGQAEHKAGRTKDAVTAYSTYVAEFPKGPQAAEALYLTGVIRQQDDDQEPAVKAYRSLLSEYGTSAFASRGRRNLGYLLHDRGDLDEAADVFVGLLDVDDGTMLQTTTLLWLGNHLFARDKFINSRKAYALYVKTDGNPLETQFARVRIGDCEYHAGNLDAAGKTYRAVLKDASDGPYRGKAQFGLGRVLLDSGKTAESVDMFAKAIETEDTAIVVEARISLGDAYMQLENYDEAARAYMMVAMIYNHETLSPECYVKAAEALEAKGDPAGARKMYEDLLNAYPESEKAATAKARLDSAE